MEELNLKDVISLFWSKRKLIILVVILFIIMGIGYSYFFIIPEYTAVTNLVLNQNSFVNEQMIDGATITSTDLIINSKLVSTYSEIIKEDIILGEVAKNLNLEASEIGNIRNKIYVSFRANTEIIEICVKNEDPNKAAQIANEIANVFSKKIVDIYNINNVYMLDRAKVPTSPSNINHIKDICLFACIGLIISFIYIIIFNMLDTTIKKEEDIEKSTNSVILISIPNYGNETNTSKGGRR